MHDARDTGRARALPTTSTPTRRAALAASVAAAAGPDAELLTLAAEFHRCEARMAELDLPENRHQDGLEAVHEEWWSAFDRAFALAAHTQAGWIAKASMLPAVIRDCSDEDGADSKAVMSLVRDMLGQTDPGPDAELIKLCDRLVAMNAEEQVIFALREDAADHEPFKSRLDALHAEWFAIDARLCDVADPVTRPGALAVAKAAVAQAPKTADGSIDAPQLAEWLAFAVAEYVAREGVA